MKNKFKNPYIKIFLLGFFTAFCIFLPFLVIDKGFFLYAGDFNSQQIPFYMYANNMVSNGSINWSWATDLGSSFINSYSFYLLGSPFFWLSSLFPHTWSPFLMPLWLMLKFAVASLGAFCFLRRYAKNDNYAFIGAILYAFCGFSVYNIFFNHFLESVAFFPFLLWALDEFIYEKKYFIFPIFVALNLVNNYFFFIGQVVFLIIYFSVKLITKEYKISVKQFFHLAFESILGCLMGIVLFVPSLLNLLQNPRIDNVAQGFGLWLYSNVQQYFAILQSAFFMPESPYAPNLFTEGSIKWTSMSAFVVLGGLFGYFIFLKHFKKSAFTKIFTVCIIFAFVPILNSSFYAFNRSYYARWYYMPILILAAMNMHSFSLDKAKIFKGIKTTALFTALFAIFALTPTKVEDKFKLGLQGETALFWLTFSIAIFSLYILFLIVYNFKDRPKYTQKLLMSALSLVMLFSCVHIAMVKLPQYKADARYKPQNYDILNTFDLNDPDKNFRNDAYQCYNNLGLFLNTPILQSFNSVVTPSIMEFYPSVGVKRDVSSKPEFEDYALRSLLSVKYLFMPTHEVQNFIDKGYMSEYEKHAVIEPYQILKNKYFIPMGFTYDYYVTHDMLLDVSPSSRSKILLKALLIEQEHINRLSPDMPLLPEEELSALAFYSFEDDVKARQNSTCYYFEMTDDGFVSNINLEKDNFVFFSVPYDEGFTAYINGEKSEIFKVNYGLSAVYAPMGDNLIEFKYRTTGLNAGIFISLIGCCIYILYLLINKFKSKGKE